VTLGESPLIRYHRPLDEKGTINRKIPEHLAKLVQAELDNFCATNPEFPVGVNSFSLYQDLIFFLEIAT
jgi:syntaxin-binding protein 1